MGGIDISSAYESMILQVPVDAGVDIELRVTYLSHQGVVLEVLAPDKFAGNNVRLPHVPAFAMPGFFGYHYAGRLTRKCTDYVAKYTREWHAKRQAVEQRIDEIREYLAVGLTTDDVAEWIRSKTGLHFRLDELPEILHVSGWIDTDLHDRKEA